MSLSKVSLATVVKKQYQFKLKSYIGMFSSLVGLQLIALLFSLGGVGQGGSGSFEISINRHYYTVDYVIAFTMIWAFITSIQMTTREYRQDDFTFVTNRLSGNLSNISFLFTASVIGGVLTVLSDFLLKVVIRFLFKFSFIPQMGLADNIGLFLKGILATILYIFLFSAIGYIIGTFVQLSKVFIIIIPGIFIGLLLLSLTMGTDTPLQLFKFYFQEAHFLLFSFKMIITSCLLVLGAVIISNRLEVR